MKRDIQGKFALCCDHYRKVRSLRLTDRTWKALGIAAGCLGMTKADYLEEVVKDNALPSITWGDPKKNLCITRLEEHLSQQDSRGGRTGSNCAVSKGRS